MTKQSRRLGRGFASLISDLSVDTDVSTAPHSAGFREIPVGAVLPNPAQPRSQFDPHQLQELVQSIRTSGIIQPIVVRPHGESYQVVAGERRWRAAKEAGLTTVPAVVRDVTDQQMLEFALIENIQREDLNPIDRAAAYNQCCQQFGLNPDQLAEHLGEDRTTVTNYIRLLDLPESVLAIVRAGNLSMGHARCLLGLGSPALIEEFAQAAVNESLSVRELEIRVREGKTAGAETPGQVQRQARVKRPLVQELEERFRQALQTRVSITEGRKKHTGRIVIEYYSVDDFGRIAERLGVKLEDL